MSESTVFYIFNNGCDDMISRRVPLGYSLIECKDFRLVLKHGVVEKFGSARDLTEAEKQEILELIEKDKKAWQEISFDHSLFRHKRFKI